MRKTRREAPCVLPGWNNPLSIRQSVGSDVLGLGEKRHSRSLLPAVLGAPSHILVLGKKYPETGIRKIYAEKSMSIGNSPLVFPRISTI